MDPSFIQYHQLLRGLPVDVFLEDWRSPFLSLEGGSALGAPAFALADSGRGFALIRETVSSNISGSAGYFYATHLINGVWSEPQQVRPFSSTINRASILAVFQVGDVSYALFSVSSGVELHRSISAGAWQSLGLITGAPSGLATNTNDPDIGFQWGSSRQRPDNPICQRTTGQSLVLIPPTATRTGRMISIYEDEVVTTELFGAGTTIDSPLLVEAGGKLYLFYSGDYSTEAYTARTVYFRVSDDGEVWSTPQPCLSIPRFTNTFAVAPQADGSLLLGATGRHATMSYSDHVYYNRLIDASAAEPQWQFDTVPLADDYPLWPPRLVNQISKEYSEVFPSGIGRAEHRWLSVTTGYVFYSMWYRPADNPNTQYLGYSMAPVLGDDVGEPELVEDIYGDARLWTGDSATSDRLNTTVVASDFPFSNVVPDGLKHALYRERPINGELGPAIVPGPTPPEDVKPREHLGFVRSPNGSAILAVVFRWIGGIGGLYAVSLRRV